MNDSIKKYPLYHDTDNGTEGWDIYDAINHSPSGIYVDVPGLGLVQVTVRNAIDALWRIHQQMGANQFALMVISDNHPATQDHGGVVKGIEVCKHGRILMKGT